MKIVLRALKTWLLFLAWGTFFSTVEEYLTIYAIDRDKIRYVASLIVIYPVYLTLVLILSKLLDLFFQRESAKELAHYATFAFTGLMLEWFAIGFVPWRTPRPHPAGELLFQLGMMAYWATVGFAPRLFISRDELHRTFARTILKFYIPFFALVYVVTFAVWNQSKGVRLIALIPLIILGYFVVNGMFIAYFRQAFAREAAPKKSPVEAAVAS